MKTYITFTEANDFEVRVSLDTPRHGGKLIASCPTEQLANNIASMFNSEKEEPNWDVLFEVCDPDAEADALEQERTENEVRWSLRDEGRSSTGLGESNAERNA